MKTVGEFKILEREKTDLTLDASFVTALGIREGAVLYGVVPQSREEGLEQAGGDAENRLMTLIVTSLPPESWPRLIRMSVTLDPQPGSLYSLVEVLNNLRIFPRHLEDVTGTTFNGKEQSGEPILPSATFVLELPRPEALNPRDAELHNCLRQVIEDHKKSAAAIERLEDVLRSTSKRKVGVRWISPMWTLNTLGEQRQAEKIKVVKSRGSAPDAVSLDLSLLPWRRLLWKPVAPFKENKREGKILAMPSLDSDEKTIAFYFYQYSNHLVVEFDLITPAFGLEHIWWEYIYDCVQAARGNVLGSASSASVNGRWKALQCTAMFPLKDPSTGAENPKPIVHCFRKLQGDRSSTEEFRKFDARVRKERDVIGSEILPKEVEENWRRKSFSSPPDQLESSQLEKLIVWDPFEDSPGPRFADFFAANPFSFTLPLDLQGYNRLYGQKTPSGAQRTRLGLAEIIADKLSPAHSAPTEGKSAGENIAIVGAHRAGKTTVLSLVYGILEQPKAFGEVPVIPVRITASVTPPHMLFMAILDEVSRPAKEVEGFRESLRRSWGKIFALAEAVLKGAELKLGPLTYKFKEPLESAREAEDSPATSDEKLRNLLVRIEEEKPAALPEFLKLSLSALRDALEALGDGVRLVVVLDEFSEAAAWGDPRTLAVWRHAIESTEYSRIRWLFSSTLPVKEAADYSPITNIFLEYNVGSLPDDESQRLLDAFSFTAWQEKEPSLRPVLTNPARTFLIGVTSSLPYLLQVSCYHVYDRATRTNFPLINMALCRKIILARVLPEIADYLEHQWSQLPEGAQRFIIDSLEALPEDLRNPNKFMKYFRRWEVPLERVPPGSLKALDRSGLRGNDGPCVAPMVAAWLLTRAGRPGGPLGSATKADAAKDDW